jgi:hypothetical protein
MGEIYAAIESLRNVIIQRYAGLDAPMDEIVDREVFFAILKKNIEEEGTTEELVTKYRPQLEKIHEIPHDWSHDSPYKKVVTNYFKAKDNKLMFIQQLYTDIWYLKQIFYNIEGYKKDLKIDGFNVDKHELNSPQGLLSRYKALVERMEEGKYKAEEVDTESQLHVAVLIKVAEKIKEMNIDLDDFAIILARHPFTIDRYNSAEYTLYDAVKWVSEGPPKDALLNSVWLRERQECKTNEAMIASRLLTNTHFGIEEYRSLRSKPWVVKELSKIANFDDVLRIYKRRLNQKFRRKKRFIDDIRKETKGTKPIDLNEELGKEDFNKNAQRY